MTVDVSNNIADGSKKEQVSSVVGADAVKASTASSPEAASTVATEESTAAETEKQKCEVREYEARFGPKGIRELVALDTKKKPADSENENGKYAFCSYKYYSRADEFERGYIQIYSAPIITALQTVIRTYPGQHFSTESSVTINHPYRPIFHYRHELAEYKDKRSDPETQKHISLLLSFVEDDIRHSLRAYMSSVENATDTPSISYDNLWMIYKPGELIFAGRKEQLRVLEVVDSWEQKGNCARYCIYGKFFTHNGKEFGYANEALTISPYTGVKPISSLSAIPEPFKSDPNSAKNYLLSRGQKFCGLRGSHYRSYSSIASAISEVRDWQQDGHWKEEAMVIKSRVMVDTEMFNIVKAANGVTLNQTKATPEDVGDNIADYISERDFMLSCWKIPGYAFTPKRWCWFSVDEINPVVFNHEAFESLLLPTRQKQLVHGLVRTHVSKADEFDDLIAGKGKGLVFVLHGTPGVGKTFTAESVADHIEQPLYVLSSGELGITPKDVENNLYWALMLATQWNAILLIDEADVFLEERSVHDLQRNTLVSLFLRTLEYYEGILFLTTNRITTFDPAFRSRIHLALKYHPLSTDSKKQLWRSFISRTSRNPPILDDAALTRLAQINLNGRQIKNAVRTASAMAKSTGEDLGELHMMEVVETIRDFEKDFAGDEDANPSSSEGSVCVIP